MSTRNGHWSRRAVLGSAVAGAAIAAAPALGTLRDRGVVKVTGGLVSGTPTRTPGVGAWLGIPYARAPVGPLRWRAPEPAIPWSGIRAADRFSSSPWAPPPATNSAFASKSGYMDEDCLTINVWAPTPGNGKPRPVMVWIYGGAFVEGSSDLDVYRGEHVAADGVVFVSFNYRVGILGFLAHPGLRAESSGGVSGNYGLLDQIAALEWVRDNIAAFGGDPADVTIAGQSAGAFSVGFHLVMPRSRGLFCKAIAQSGAPMGKPSSLILLGESAPMEERGSAFAARLDAPRIEDLRALSAAALVEANRNLWEFYPAIDGKLIPDHPFQLMKRGLHADVPLIAGFNHDEGGIFPPLGGGSVRGFEAALDEVYGDEAVAARRLFAVTNGAQAIVAGRAVFADVVFNWNSAALAGAQAAFGTAPAYLYHFRFAPALHGGEIASALGNLDNHPRRMRTISSYWMSFVKSGDPNSPLAPVWPRFVPAESSVLQMDSTGFTAVDLPFRERLELMGRAMGNGVLTRPVQRS